MTKFYKFPDEAAYQTNRQDAVPVVVLGRVPDGGEAVIEIDGEPVTVPTYHEGYHVNAMSPVEGWDAYLVEPTTPWMIFG